MSIPLLETNFDTEDISEPTIRVVENYTGIVFTQAEKSTIIEVGKCQPNILDGLDAIENLLFWFDYKGPLADVLKKLGECIPDLSIKVVKANYKSGRSFRPPIPEYNPDREVYDLEYSFNEGEQIFHDVVDVKDRAIWFNVLLARIASHSGYALIPLLVDAESIFIRCTVEKFRAYYPDWSVLAQKKFNAPLPEATGIPYKALPLEDPLDYKIFYRPTLYSVIDGKACLLSYSGSTEVPIGERVRPGESIVQAVNQNLKATFGYKGRYEIKSFVTQDVTLDSKGIRTQRFNSVIKLLDPLDLTQRPFDYALDWDDSSGNNFESMKVLYRGDTV